MKRKTVIILITIVSIAALGSVFSSCAPAGEGLTVTQDEAIEEETEEQDAEVIMSNYTFGPQSLTVGPGTTVTWVNEDNYVHNVISGTRGSADAGEMFDSGNIPGGATFEFTFQEPGTYDYFCDLHPGMDGIIIVE